MQNNTKNRFCGVAVAIAVGLSSLPVLAQNPNPRILIPRDRITVAQPITPQIRAGVVQEKAARVDLNPASPDIQVLKRAPVATQLFPVADPQTRAPIPPGTILTLPDGRKVEAATYYAELNKLEKGLNDLGYSLRTMPKELVLQKSVVNEQLLQQQAKQIVSVGPRLQETTLKTRVLEAPMLAGGQRVLMADELTAAKIQAVRAGNVGKALDLRNNQLQIVPQTAVKPILNPAVIAGATQGQREGGAGGVTAIDKARLNPALIGKIGGIKLPPAPRVKTFHREQPWNWSVGNPSSFQAYLRGKLVADGKAYEVANPSDAELNKSNSEFSLGGDTQAGGSILGRNVTLLNASANFLAPSNTTRPLNANARVQVLGVTVFNFNQNVPTNWSKTETLSHGLRYGVPFGIPLGPVWLGGEIGAQGDAGLRYSVSMNRAGVGGSVGPFIRASVYGEGGVSVVVAGAGVGVSMTLLDAELDLYGQARLGWFLKWIFMQDCYVGYKVRALNGRVYGYVYVYVPAWSIPPWEKKQWEHNFWNWGGLGTEGTLVDFHNQIVFDNWGT